MAAMQAREAEKPRLAGRVEVDDAYLGGECFLTAAQKASIAWAPLRLSGPGGRKSASSVKKAPEPGAPGWLRAVAYRLLISWIVSSATGSWLPAPLP